MQSLISDAVDYKGNAADRTTTGGWVSAALILGIEVCERMATMGIVVNIVTYVVGTMHLPSATASNVATNFGGSSYLFCLLGGILADTFFGRYWTIVIFAIVNALGTCMLAISTALPQLRPPPCISSGLSNKCEEANDFQMGIFNLALYVYGIGLGGVKSSVSGLGTDQFDQKDDKEKAHMVYFFGRFYLIISFGTLLGVTVLVWIQDTKGRSWGYGISSVAMILALAVFLAGTKRYRYKKRAGSPIFQILQVLVAASKKRNVPFPSTVSSLHEDYKQETTISRTEKYSCLDKASIITEEDMKRATPNPWRLCTVTRVEEVKMMVGLIPIWASTIMFWTVYAQMASFSVQQASTMDRHLGNFIIPPGSYNVFLIGPIMITLAIYDRLFMPLFKKYSKRKQGLTSLQKIGIGLFFSILAMGAAALVETRRLSIAKAKIETNTSTIRPMSAFFLLPQFISVGIGNAFIYAGQLDFFITQSPKGMKAIGTGLFLTTLSFGFFVSTTLVTIVKKVTGRHGRQNWLARGINDSRLDYFYWLLAVLSLVNLGFFLVCAIKYKPNNPGEDAENRELVDVQIPPKEDNL
ncbi:hypothetical protein Ddye_021168 [Dipteronia dyeriana]|uniref:Uncharacterized protein n=1 Tax=Dipteronia dyeriana TaxID=168575 RepID=A0AAD9U1K9_9ROSI|nr:hypothetical protein Ddye_021168 [Dipteronia dyeriana]